MLDNKFVKNYGEFDKLCEKVSDFLNEHVNDDEKNNEFYKSYNDDFSNGYKINVQNKTLFLSNGDALNVVVPLSSIPHLLGFNTDYLVSAGIYNEDNAYRILKKILENKYSLYQKHKEGIIDLNKVISPYADKKLEAISKNLRMDINRTDFVCKFDIRRAYGTNNNRDIDYLIVSHDDEDKYYMLLLAKSETLNTKRTVFIPQSNREYDSYEEFFEEAEDMLYNQELAFLNSIIIKNKYAEDKKIWLSADLLKAKCQNLNTWSQKLFCIPNVLNNLIYSVNINKDRGMATHNISESLSTIADSIENGRIIDKTSFYDLTPEIIAIINAYNDSLCKNLGGGYLSKSLF